MQIPRWWSLISNHVSSVRVALRMYSSSFHFARGLEGSTSISGLLVHLKPEYLGTSVHVAGRDTTVAELTGEEWFEELQLPSNIEVLRSGKDRLWIRRSGQ